MNTLLFQRFGFIKPIQLEELALGMGDEIVALPDKIIIKMDKQAEEKNLAEILSKAKLGETDPLFATFYFQENLTPNEERLASQFSRLCQPLQDAWIYKTMRRYAPDVYDAEIKDLLETWEKIFPSLQKDTDPETRRIALGIFTILSENPQNKIDLILLTDDANRADWDNYLSMLKELIHAEPQADLFLRLAVAANSPYKVTIANQDGFRHFIVSEK